MAPPTIAELEAALAGLRSTPADGGRVELVVRRPEVGEREILVEGLLDPGVGLVGDTWSTRPSRQTADGGPPPGMQLTLMNARMIGLLTSSRDEWALAGDQLYVDLDLGVGNLPAGARLRVGDAVVELSAEPHTGCAKFTQRFGLDAMRFVNSPVGRELRLRGANARVVEGGAVRVGDVVTKC